MSSRLTLVLALALLTSCTSHIKQDGDTFYFNDWRSLLNEFGAATYTTKGLENKLSKFGFFVYPPNCQDHWLLLWFPTQELNSLNDYINKEVSIKAQFKGAEVTIGGMFTKIIQKDNSSNKALFKSDNIPRELKIELSKYDNLILAVTNPKEIVDQLAINSDRFSLDGYTINKYETSNWCNKELIRTYGKAIGPAPKGIENGQYIDEANNIFTIIDGLLYKRKTNEKKNDG